MPPPLKSRRCQEDGFDRGKPRSSRWWRTAGVGKNGLLRLLFVCFVVAPHWSPSQETSTFSSACSDLKHAKEAELVKGVAAQGKAREESNTRTVEHTAGEIVGAAAVSTSASVAVGCIA